MEVPEELANRYLERRIKDLEVCIDSLKYDNYQEIERVGHKLKGSGMTFGYEELSNIGEKIERAASISDVKKLEDAIQGFSEWINCQLN